MDDGVSPEVAFAEAAAAAANSDNNELLDIPAKELARALTHHQCRILHNFPAEAIGDSSKYVFCVMAMAKESQRKARKRRGGEGERERN